ncbi:UDP-galactose/UDP-glucose transporter 5B [Physcomitrium patens]|uniref:Uncharacterized protein n=1 Tax=Physcomitrium patens TaxID=3218 RepID=A0A2K1JJ73_PHYPA|nr:UDP-galactose/UDP-glucose transporter 5B-like [Physcomitrium patens]PNR41589.1 hypothetical protein PHYPA_018992 [Physcomitrium patens]|eukprot:XP_024395412.1 UDP-galactose/UDP-glucose transporter 5B-like [Physcomitrella patens]
MALRDSRVVKLGFCVGGVMSTLVIYGLLQEKIMRAPYGGVDQGAQEFFNFPLFIVFCNRLLTCAICLGILMVRGGEIAPVAPLYKYAGVSVSNVAATTCQYEALKYVSFPVQTLSKSAKMVPVMIWGTAIMQKRYNYFDYLVAVFVTLGCTMFFLSGASQLVQAGALRHPSSGDDSLWGLLLITGYLGFDGFTSTFQDKLFKGYNMEIYNQILYVTLCSCGLSIAGLLTQGHWLPAIEFLSRHPDCLLDIAMLSAAASTSQFFISYTIRTFGALVFATIMTTRQLVSILLSCAFFGNPPTAPQWAGASMVFGALYFKTYLNSKKSNRQGPPKSSLPVEGGSTSVNDEKDQPVKLEIGRIDPPTVVEKLTA